MSNPTGRDSIFRGKDKAARYQGVVTSDGRTAIEHLRAGIAALFEKVMGRKSPQVGDTDILEALARDTLTPAERKKLRVQTTRAYLEDRRRAEQ